MFYAKTLPFFSLSIRFALLHQFLNWSFVLLFFQQTHTHSNTNSVKSVKIAVWKQTMTVKDQIEFNTRPKGERSFFDRKWSKHSNNLFFFYFTIYWTFCYFCYCFLLGLLFSFSSASSASFYSSCRLVNFRSSLYLQKSISQCLQKSTKANFSCSPLITFQQ